MKKLLILVLVLSLLLFGCADEKSESSSEIINTSEVNEEKSVSVSEEAKESAPESIEEPVTEEAKEDESASSSQIAPVDPVMPNFFGSNQAMMYETFLQEVNERLKEVEENWGSYDKDTEGNYIIYEKNAAFTDSFFENFFMKYPELKAKLEGKIVRNPCKFSIKEKKEAHLAIQTTDIFSSGKACINFSPNPDIINISIFEDGGEKEIYEAIKTTNFPKENVKITLEELRPINPSM